MASMAGSSPVENHVTPIRYDRTAIERHAGFLRCACIALGALACLVAIGVQSASAFFGGDRTITLYHAHTKESLTVTFKRGGSYDPKALEQLNWFLRDWRRDEPTRMDPRLFDVLWEVYQEAGASSAITVVSAYRSPETNGMLRRRSSAVAKNSQHMLGKAMDFHLPGVTAETIRAIGVKMQRGGVGYYPGANTPFIHLDVGSVRAWPRLSQDQLARLFPDGKTVHIPANGRPLPGYELAKAEILSRGGSVLGYAAVAEGEEETASGGNGRSKSLWATLFGGDEDEDAAEIIAPQPRSRGASRGTQTASYDNQAISSNSAASFFVAEAARAEREENFTAPSASARANTAGRNAPLSPDNGPFETNLLPTSAPIPPQRTFAFAALDIPPEQLGDGQGFGNGSRASVVPSVFSGPLPPPRPELESDNTQPTPTNSPTVSSEPAPLPPVRPNAIALVSTSAPEPSIASLAAASTVTPEAATPTLPAQMPSQHPLPPPRPSALSSSSATETAHANTTDSVRAVNSVRPAREPNKPTASDETAIVRHNVDTAGTQARASHSTAAATAPAKQDALVTAAPSAMKPTPPKVSSNAEAALLDSKPL